MPAVLLLGPQGSGKARMAHRVAASTGAYLTYSKGAITPPRLQNVIPEFLPDAVVVEEFDTTLSEAKDWAELVEANPNITFVFCTNTPVQEALSNEKSD